MITKTELGETKELFCPLCGGKEFGKSGYIRSRKLRGYGKILAQAFFCKQCGMKIVPDYERQRSRYSKVIKAFAITQIKNDSMKSCQDISDLIEQKFFVRVDIGVINKWIVKAGVELQHRRKKAWKTMRRKYGSSGFTNEWFRKRSLASKKLWKNPEYRKRVSNAHRHPYHKSEIVAYAFSLESSGLSLRQIATQINCKFGTHVDHSSVSHWFKHFSRPLFFGFWKYWFKSRLLRSEIQ